MHITCAKHTGPLKQNANFNSITELQTVKNSIIHFLHIVHITQRGMYSKEVNFHAYQTGLSIQKAHQWST